MSPAAVPAAAARADWLVALAARCLDVPPGDIDPRAPLGRYGLDSLAAIELTAAVEKAIARPLPETAVLEDLSVEALADLLRDAPGGSGAGLAAMVADSRLPADVRPAAGARVPAGGPVLVTGATGFLGAYLLRALLVERPGGVRCLVRADGAEAARARVRAALSGYGIWDAAFEPRLEVVAGDIGRPRLGLDAPGFDRLARGLAGIYHCAADVNWVAPYARLRAVNVLGARELLRLACHQAATPFHFVSTLGVCYATTGPREVGEATDMLPYLAGLHLGYAQSKCVAEALVREAARRGLPAAVYRPAFIAGDARTGTSNAGDFLSRLLKGCIEMGCAPDVDWRLDACPVDSVATAIVRLGAAGGPGRPAVHHLASPRPGHWRECVLWLNLYGYAVRLLPYREWLARLGDARDPGHALHPLRGFFLTRLPGASGLTLPELYEEGRRSRARSDRTRRALAARGVPWPALDARLLDRSVASLVAAGFLPPVPGRGPAAALPEPDPFADPAVFEPMIRHARGDERLRVTGLALVDAGSAHSILTELASWRTGRSVGLRRYRLALATGSSARAPLDVMLKLKPEDTDLLAVGAHLARLCGDALGEAYARFSDRLGVAGCHRRELAVYEQTDERFRRHTPRLYGTWRDETRRVWALVLEYLDDVVLRDTADDPRGWRPAHVAAAVGGLAELHAIWYGREAALAPADWLAPAPSASDMAAAAPLWIALAGHAARFFTPWVGAGLARRHRALIDDVECWWGRLVALPRTLVHGDFNPRNVALRPTAAGYRLCAYDWELAGVGLPQRDLAEFLCFVRRPTVSSAEVDGYVELHRACLAQATGRAIDPVAWRLGVALALDELLLTRLPIYALVHAVRRQAFLPRVVRTWWRLRAMFPEGAT